MRSETARSPVVHEEVECTSSYHPNDCRLHRQRLLTYPASLNHAYVRLAFLSPRERSLRPIFLHEGPLAVAPTIITGWRTCARPTWPLVVGAEHQRCRVFGSTKPAHGDGSRCCQQLFSNTQIFPCRFYIFFLPSPFFRSCISILFHASSPPPPRPFFFLSALHAS